MQGECYADTFEDPIVVIDRELFISLPINRDYDRVLIIPASIRVNRFANSRRKSTINVI